MFKMGKNAVFSSFKKTSLTNNSIYNRKYTKINA